MSQSPLKPYGDILTVTGKYMKDGKEKNRYAKVGTLFTTPHMSRIVIKLDTVPISGEGWLSVFPKEGTEDIKPQKTDEPIDLSEIPF